MLEFFVIFTKSGLVLFATVKDNIASSVNNFIRYSLLEEKNNEQFSTDQLTIKYRLDNDFEIVFVAGYQKILKLAYVDKFLDDIQLKFRDKYTDYDLRRLLKSADYVDFLAEYRSVYSHAVENYKVQPQVEMRTFQQSEKSKKTVASMIIRPGNNSLIKKTQQPQKEQQQQQQQPQQQPQQVNKKLERKSKGKDKQEKQEKQKRTKEMRQWDLSNKNADGYDFSKKLPNGTTAEDQVQRSSSLMKQMTGASTSAELGMLDMRPNLQFESGDNDDDDDDDEDDNDNTVSASDQSKKGWFSGVMKTLSYNKPLELTDLEPILAQLRDHLIGKNVAAEIATKLCDSVATKLCGQQVNHWIGLKSFVRSALEESILRILSPNRNINVLRDIKTKVTKPYVITFCGVNGVGKSTNLAKISNWLMVNGLNVLVIACDTFRAGAIEQLRTHVSALKSIHQVVSDGGKIELFERGYGKDSAGIAMEGIFYARNNGYDVCLVDTAGRMQDNEPLMKQLAKLIKVNEPDLTLFVGEALVGNEAIDQLTKFNNSLLDNGCRDVSNTSSAINGIVLTKFDTIDDQVGAAVSMTYITGQPILFVGVGQTYRDLKQLDAKSVVKALMR